MCLLGQRWHQALNMVRILYSQLGITESPVTYGQLKERLIK